MRILVVDDEPAIRHLMDRYLTRQGHDVLVAPSAGEANAIVLDSWRPFDAAVLDIGLPGMDGMAFGELLFRLFPGIRLVFISGATNWQGRRPAGAPLLVKPFNMTDLVTMLGDTAAVVSVTPSPAPDRGPTGRTPDSVLDVAARCDVAAAREGKWQHAPGLHVPKGDRRQSPLSGRR